MRWDVSHSDVVSYTAVTVTHYAHQRMFISGYRMKLCDLLFSVTAKRKRSLLLDVSWLTYVLLTHLTLQQRVLGDLC